ncbi:MAG: hypothetical protein JSS62_02545 [Verrucomicrobia bacterium]|nr:hypothetical protein [Verrucomicrobiota bacterium]MBS0646929.1 hypothetical protein [Verrucomicrobiota bacterium]
MAWGYPLEAHAFRRGSSHQATGRYEVDLIYQKGHQLIPIEIKSSQTYNGSFLEGIQHLKNLAPDRCLGGYVIYSCEEEMNISHAQLLNYLHIGNIIR